MTRADTKGAMNAEPGHTGPETCRALVRATLFDADRGDRTIQDVTTVHADALSDRQLLWIDLQRPAESELRAIAKQLSLPDASIESVLQGGTNPALHDNGEYFWLRAVAVDDEPGADFRGGVLTLIAGINLVVSIHQQPIEFIDRLCERESVRSDIGALGAASFTASLLDWHLSTYFQAVSRFEMEVERLEVDILSDRPRQCLAELRALRKAASRLRRMLAPHRAIFSGLARPDFRPGEEHRTDGHFLALQANYERAMDMVENARDLVVGSFELFSSQTALVTNESMRTLTFATVVIGMLALIAGILGMNFETPFFKSGMPGFITAAGAMLLLTVAAILIGRKRGWL
jgi:Mg2+ and Co2+ transporter CorA